MKYLSFSAGKKSVKIGVVIKDKSLHDTIVVSVYFFGLYGLCTFSGLRKVIKPLLSLTRNLTHYKRLVHNKNGTLLFFSIAEIIHMNYQIYILICIHATKYLYTK